MAAVAIAFVTLVAAPGVARADDPDLGVSGRTRLVHDPATALVHATVDLELTNRKPSTATTFFFYTSYTLAIPAGARAVRVTSRGSSVSTTLKHSEDPSIDLLRVDLPSRLLYGQTRELRLTYDLPGAKPRSANPIRIGAGYATFPALSPGDKGHNRLEIVLPAVMATWSSPDVELLTELPATPETRARRQRVLLATRTNTPNGLSIAFSAQAPDGLVATMAFVEGHRIDVMSWPEDEEWATNVKETVVAGIPALEKLTGAPWPDEIRTVREDSGTGIFGFDGFYDRRTHEIVLSDSHEPHLVLHELSHAFSNTDIFDARWLSEGLAEFLATRAARELGVRDLTFDPVSRTSKDALPLQQWRWPADGVSDDTDAYAYPAAGQAMTALLGSARPEQLEAILGAATKGSSGYDVDEASLLDDTSTRRFLDIVEGEIAGPAPTSAYRTWVVPGSQAALLTRRAASRSAWKAIDRADGAWKPPLAYRRALTDWEFEDADAMAAEIRPMAANAGATIRAAAATGIPVPEDLRTAYEDANNDEEIATAVRLISKAPASVVAISRAEDAVERAEGGGPLVAFAAEQLGVRHDLDAANASLRSGEGDPAALAGRAADRAGWALPLAVGGLAGAVLLAFALAWVVSRVLGSRTRRRARRA